MKKYLVIGNPIEHSLSPMLHNYWIKEKNIDAVYDKKKLDESDLKDIISKTNSTKIGFALETEDGINNAKMKMNKKGLDFILLNYANEKDAGFNSDTNHIYLFAKDGTEHEFPLDTKHRLSRSIIEYIIQYDKTK